MNDLITLRNKLKLLPFDLYWQIGEETGRIIFARESASFNPELAEFIVSGSTAEIFSRVTGINGGTPFGSLVFQTNTDAGAVNQEVMEIGPGKGSTQATAPGVGISGSLKIIDSIPIFELEESNGNTKPIEIRVKSTDNDQGIIKVREAKKIDFIERYWLIEPHLTTSYNQENRYLIAVFLPQLAALH